MSFSAAVKSEICRDRMRLKCCAQAEACGILLFCNRFAADEVRIVTESAALADRLPALFRKAFRLNFDRQPEPGTAKQVFEICEPEKLQTIFNTYGYDPQSLLAHHLNFATVEENHCRLAFLRGAFLAGGSVTDPSKGYHMEFVTSHFNVSREMTALLLDMGFEPKLTQRKSNYVIYFKQSHHIEDMLTTLGAPVSAMEIMNAKLEKQLRGVINRRVNCDAANLDKAVDAAQEQIAAIRRLDADTGLEHLPDKLCEAARLRLANPALTLSQLAELCDPPVTKSCLNHRLRKLVAMSKE